MAVQTIETTEEFLKRVHCCDETCIVNLKPYENGTLVESIPFRVAVARLNNDVDEMINFFEDAGVPNFEDEGRKAAYRIWGKHVVVYNKNKEDK